jgi:hypothetical protein
MHKFVESNWVNRFCFELSLFKMPEIDVFCDDKGTIRRLPWEKKELYRVLDEWKGKPCITLAI